MKLFNLLNGVPDNVTTRQTPIIIWIIFGSILALFAVFGFIGIYKDKKSEKKKNKDKNSNDSPKDGK